MQPCMHNRPPYTRHAHAMHAQEVMTLLKRDPVVSYVMGTMTEEIGPRIYRFKAEVAWDGAKVRPRVRRGCGVFVVV